MTAIMAYKSSDEPTYVFADSGETSGVKLVAKGLSKIFKVRTRPDLLFAASGTVAVIDFIRSMQTQLAKIQLTADYLKSQFVPMLFKKLGENDMIEHDEDKNIQTGCTLIIASRKDAFYISQAGIVIHGVDFLVGGSGLLGIQMTVDQLELRNLPAKERCLKAMQASIAMHDEIIYPIDYASFNDDVIHRVYEDGHEEEVNFVYPK